MRLGLGTAQFGLDYGITSGTKVDTSEVGRILNVAKHSGINTLDTAPAYGTSEEVLGFFDAGEDFQIVTKTPKNCTVDELRAAFETSLARFGRIYGLLLHDAADTHLWGELERLKAEGLVKKIGFSIYDWADISDRPFDIIQAPFNALDQRLASDLKWMHDNGVEIHVRSIFLQGLLLQRPDRFPPHLAPLAQAVEEMQRSFAWMGIPVLEGALAAVLQCPYIDCAIVGVTSVKELREIIAAARNVEGVRVGNFTAPPEYVNPAKWHELV